MRLVDLSVPLEASPSEPVRPEVDFEDHDRTAPLVAGIFGCDVGQLPDGKGWASETVTAITHAGTHVDAPYHYFPTCGGERARTTDELPLEWFLAPGVRLDLRGLEHEYCQLEKLHNLGALPDGSGFTVSCLPVKITGASAGWCRAVAVVDGA